MSALDAAISVVADCVSYILGRVLGPTFTLDRDKAQRIGETVLIVAFAAFILLLALLGVGT
jgi:hypothetical protein